jgi:hypothetical protein
VFLNFFRHIFIWKFSYIISLLSNLESFFLLILIDYYIKKIISKINKPKFIFKILIYPIGIWFKFISSLIHLNNEDNLIFYNYLRFIQTDFKKIEKIIQIVYELISIYI